MLCLAVLGHQAPAVVAEAQFPEVFAPVGLKALAEPGSPEELVPQGSAEALTPPQWLVPAQKAHLVVRFRLC